MTFVPNYTLTNNIVSYLTRIAAAREAILNAPILPQWEVRLRNKAVLKMAHHSTAIEGNRLSLSQVERLMAGEDVAAREKDKREVQNYIRVLEYIDKLGEEEGTIITEDVILEIHRLNTEGLLNDEDSGHYRTVPVAVVNGLGLVTFQPPPEVEVPELMASFTAWLNSEEAKELYSVLEAGIAHYEFVRIHPFVDGNGRTARALATLVLYLRGFDTKRFFALDDYYNEELGRYYAALQTVDPETIDITQWLEYFCEGVAVSMDLVKETLREFSLDRRLKEEKGQVFLDDRQMEVLRYLNTHPRITSGEIQDMFGLSRGGVSILLRPLLDHELIIMQGKGKATHYILG